jgi:demethylmenaquinone methyltransferase/2-methoxy-6-polyprenyl-1,4-benzoquinol methylase
MTAQSDNMTGRAEKQAGLETDFGFETVALGDKQDRVNQVFEQVARRYDLMNDLMSGGLHRAWKAHMVNWLAPPKGNAPFAIIDVAGGTGDVAFRLLGNAGPGVRVTVCDINREMAVIGARRAKDLGLDGRVDFTVGNAEALPCPPSSFDAYTIAFGIRNVPRIETALKEAFRVLKPGGRFMCLEFSKVQAPVLDKIYDAYSFAAIHSAWRL